MNNTIFLQLIGTSFEWEFEWINKEIYTKKSNFYDCIDEVIKMIQEKLNNRTRKRYNYKTPIFVLEKLILNTEFILLAWNK